MISDILSGAILLVLCFETYLVFKNIKLQEKMVANDKQVIKALKDKPETKIVVPAPVYEYETKARCDE